MWCARAIDLGDKSGSIRCSSIRRRSESPAASRCRPRRVGGLLPCLTLKKFHDEKDEEIPGAAGKPVTDPRPVELRLGGECVPKVRHQRAQALNPSTATDRPRLLRKLVRQLRGAPHRRHGPDGMLSEPTRHSLPAMSSATTRSRSIWRPSAPGGTTMSVCCKNAVTAEAAMSSTAAPPSGPDDYAHRVPMAAMPGYHQDISDTHRSTQSLRQEAAGEHPVDRAGRRPS